MHMATGTCASRLAGVHGEGVGEFIASVKVGGSSVEEASR